MEIQAWLESIGMQSYLAAFEANEVSVEDLGRLDSQDLRDDLGVSKLLDRKKILGSIRELQRRAALPRAATQASSYPEGLDPGQMPTHLAHPWNSFLLEDHPRVKLHWLIDTAELAARWAVAVSLAEVLEDYDSMLPPKMALALRDHIERPTLGRWLGILRELSNISRGEPRVAPGVFGLYEAVFEPLFVSEHQGGTLEDSLLVLRNQIAHGGGMSSDHAARLLEAHEPHIEDLLRQVVAPCQQADVVATDGDGGGQQLRGLVPAPLESLPGCLASAVMGTWLVSPDGGTSLPLLPMAIFAPVQVVDHAGQVQARPGGAVPQVYTRSSPDRLSYTPLGRDEAHSEVLDVEHFRKVFRLDELQEKSRAAALESGLRWDDALRKARALAEELVGRKDEIKEVKNWLKSDTRDPALPKIGWLWGGPGLGKSIIMAKLAADYASGKHNGLFFHRFGGGNARAMRRTFLQLLLAALTDWEPVGSKIEEPDLGLEGDELEEAVLARLALVEPLEAHHPKAPQPSFWVMIDGLEEIAGEDEGFLALLRKMALPGTRWLVAGRPDHGLDEELGRGDEASESIFEEGLPPMSPQDMRAMLLEGLGNARYALLRLDEEDEEAGGRVHNQFVERVVERARGLPVYVQLLLDDLRSGKLTVQDQDKLPDGLTDYYDALMQRGGLSTVHRDLPLIVALLARVEEPLDADSLVQLLCPHTDDLPQYQERIAAALRVGQPLMRRATTPEGSDGFGLYHQSFREYIAGRPARGDQPASPPAVALAGALREGERRLLRMADAWRELPPGSLRKHLFRWATAYAVAWAGDDVATVDRAIDRLLDYDYLHARLEELPSATVIDLVAEYQDLLDRLPTADPRRPELEVWESFLRERAHIIARGYAGWDSHKILLQLAIEHADDSPVTAAAEAFLDRGGCDWLWLRRARRPAHIKPNLTLHVYEGHEDRVEGAFEIEDGHRLVSWAKDGSLRLWERETGAELACMEAHEDAIDETLLLGDGDEQQLLSWSRDGDLALWNLGGDAPEERARFQGHEKNVLGAAPLDGKRLVSWSEDKTIRLWDRASGQELERLEGHTRPLRGAALLEGGRLVSWSDDKSVRLWDLEAAEEVLTLKGTHEREVVGAVVLADGNRLVSWDMDGALVLWDLGAKDADGAALAHFTGHGDRVMGAMALSDGRLLSWSKDNTLRLWDMTTGEELGVLEGHKDLVDGALELDEGARLLSWSKDATLRLWDLQELAPLHTLEGHSSWVRGAQLLSSGEILSWSGGGALRIWDAADAECLAVLEGHTAGVWGARELSDGRVVSWSWDMTLRLWRWERDEGLEEMDGHVGWINFATFLEDDRPLSWGSDALIVLWDPDTGAPERVYRGHDKSIGGVRPFDDNEKMLSWSSDQTLRVWDVASGDQLAVMEGHGAKIQGAMLLDEERALSWSSDASLRVWSLESGDQLALMEEHSKLVQGVRRLADGRLVSWSSDGTIKLWDSESYELLKSLDDHGKLVREVIVLRDGRLVSCSSDKTLRIWDPDQAAEEACLAVLKGHKGLALGVEELDDGRLVSWGKNNELRLWSSAGEELQVFEGDDNPADGALELPSGALLSWSRKSKAFCQWDMDTGALIERVDWEVAALERPELWRARMAYSKFDTLRGVGRAHGTDGGASLFFDTKEAGDGTPPLVCWRGTSKWTGDTLSEAGALCIHANNYFHVLHLYHGTERVGLEEGARRASEQ